MGDEGEDLGDEALLYAGVLYLVVSDGILERYAVYCGCSQVVCRIW